MSIEDLKNRLKSIFPINVKDNFVEKIEEEEPADSKEDNADEDLFGDDTEDTGETDDTNTDNQNDDETEDSEESSDEEPEDSEEDTSEEPKEDENLTAEQKIEKLFKDSGVSSKDWSVSNENNQRLAIFKFKLIGLDYENLLSEQEKAEGVPSNVLEQRLSTEEKAVYVDAVNKLRQKYPLIAKREKNMILWNASIPILAKNGKGEILNVYEDKDSINDAFEKIDQYLSNKYEENWQDNKDAINFIRNIKINFTSEKSKITPNLLTNSKLTKLSEKELIPFNTLNFEPPDSVIGFIRDNVKNELYKSSPIFNTLSGDFSQSGNLSRGSIYPIIRGTVKEEDTAADGENVDSDAGGDSGGGLFGGEGDSGGFGEGGPEISDGGEEGDIGGDIGGDEGDIGGDEGGDTGGDEESL